MFLELTDAGRRIIDAVIDAPVAWRSPGQLAERLHWSLDQTLDEIATLNAGGWLEAWELVDGPVVTLSVVATANYGVRLVEVGRDEIPKWARAGDPDPPHHRAVGVFRNEKAAALNLVADSRDSVEYAAILAEEANDLAAATASAASIGSIDRRPRPTLLIGGSLSPWPGPRQMEGQDCPACRLAHLPAQAYCIWCDRWGLDLEVKPIVVIRKRERRPSSRDQQIQVEAKIKKLGRWKRQQKRKERRLVQVQERQIKSMPTRP